MNKSVYAVFFVFGVILLWAFLLQQKDLIGDVTLYIESTGSFSYFIYVLILIATGVFLPLSAMPLIPLAASVMGPLPAALLSIVGWTLGAAIAFLLARRFGRKAIEGYVSFEKLDALVALVPQKNRFFYVLIFRLVLPTDLANYALGLTKSLGFTEYIAATLVSFIWYSFLLSYLGYAVLQGEFMLAVKLLVALLVIFAIGWYLLKHSKTQN